MEIEAQEDFLSFEVDMVAEQLTYMDAVSLSAFSRISTKPPELRFRKSVYFYH